MTNNDYPRLCGGTFFTLLLQALKQRQKARDSYAGSSDRLSNTNMLIGLIKVAQPSYIEPAESTFSQNTSKYKSSEISGGTYLPFDDSTFVSSFDTAIKKQYATALASMSEFVDTFIATDIQAKCECLVEGILELIESDNSIKETDAFYVCPDGQPLSKSQLRSISSISLQPFLLGVWHFIIANRPDNGIGRQTYLQWHEEPEIKGRQPKFASKIGESITCVLDVTVLANVTVSDSGLPEIDAEIVESEVLTADVVADHDPKRITVNNYGTVENQKFVSIETMNGDLHL